MHAASGDGRKAELRFAVEALGTPEERADERASCNTGFGGHGRVCQCSRSASRTPRHATPSLIRWRNPSQPSFLVVVAVQGLPPTAISARDKEALYWRARVRVSAIHPPFSGNWFPSGVAAASRPCLLWCIVVHRRESQCRPKLGTSSCVKKRRSISRLCMHPRPPTPLLHPGHPMLLVGTGPPILWFPSVPRMPTMQNRCTPPAPTHGAAPPHPVPDPTAASLPRVLQERRDGRRAASQAASAGRWAPGWAGQAVPPVPGDLRDRAGEQCSGRSSSAAAPQRAPGRGPPRPSARPLGPRCESLQDTAHSALRPAMPRGTHRTCSAAWRR